MLSGDLLSRKHARRVTGVYPRLLDMFLNAGYDDSSFVGQSVNVYLRRTLEKLVDEDGLFRRRVDSRPHVIIEGLLIINDRHSPAAENKAGPDHDRVTYFVCSSFGLVG